VISSGTIYLFKNLVQKVLPVQSAVARLCNIKKQGSFGGRINFDELEKVPFSITGVYGRQELVLQYLVHIGAVDPNNYLLFFFFFFFLVLSKLIFS
jgi:hypothetical protein